MRAKILSYKPEELHDDIWILKREPRSYLSGRSEARRLESGQSILSNIPVKKPRRLGQEKRAGQRDCNGQMTVKIQWGGFQTGREGLLFSELIKWHGRKVCRIEMQ